MNPRRSWLAAVALLLLVLLLGAALLVRTRAVRQQVRGVIERALARQLNLSVRIGDIAIRPGLAAVTLYDVVLMEGATGASLLTADRVLVGLRFMSLLTGEVRARSLTFSGARLTIEDTAALRASLDTARVALGVPEARARAAGLSIAVERGVVIYRNLRADFDVRLEDLSASLSWTMPDSAVLALAVHRLDGRLGTRTLTGARLDARARLHLNAVHLERMHVATSGSSLVLDGALDASGDKPRATLAARGEVDSRELFSFLGWGRGDGGMINLMGQLSGEPFPEAVRGKLELTRGARRLVVDGQARYRNGHLALREFLVVAGETRLRADGTVRAVTEGAAWTRWRRDLRLDVAVKIRGRVEDLTDWFGTWPVRGPIDLIGHISGQTAGIEGRGRIEMAALQIGEARLEQLRADLFLKGTELAISGLTARRGDVRIEGDGTVTFTGHYRGALAPMRLDLAKIARPTTPGARGSIVLRLWGEGRWPERRVQGEAQLADLVVGEARVGPGTVRLALDGDQWRWELRRPTGLSGRGRVPMSLSGPLQAELTASDLDLLPFLPRLRAHLRVPLTVRADGQATLRGTLPDLRDLSGRIELTALRGQGGAVPFHLERPASLSVVARRLSFTSLDLTGPELSVRLEGSVLVGESVDVALTGQVPGAILQAWVPALEALHGAPRVRLTFAGPRDRVRAGGDVELARTELTFRALPMRLSISSGEARFDHSGLDVVIRDGAVAGGRVEGRGSARRVQGGRWRHTIDYALSGAAMDQVHEELQPERRRVSGTLSTSGTLTFETGPGRRPLETLGGDLSITLRDGSVSEYPILVRIFGLLGAPAQPYRLPDLTKERLPYRRFSGDFSAKGGAVETRNIILDSDVVLLSATGTIDLVAGPAVDLDVAARPLRVLERGVRRIPLIARVLPKEHGLAVTYFTVEGSWDDPKVSAAPLRSLSETVAQHLLLLLRLPERLIAPAR
jgi:hypothetical protein